MTKLKYSCKKHFKNVTWKLLDRFYGACVCVSCGFLCNVYKFLFSFFVYLPFVCFLKRKKKKGGLCGLRGGEAIGIGEIKHIQNIFL